MNKVLITGGMGLIGSGLVKYFLKHSNDKIFIIDNLSSGIKSNLTLSNEHLDNQIIFIEMDVTSPDLENSITFNPDIIYHLASRASPVDFLEYPLDILQTNSIGTNNMLEVARLCNSKFILASTSEIYGNPKEHPQSEDYYGNVNPTGLRSCYYEGKRFAESITMTYHRKFNLNTVIVRLFNTYGPNLRKNDGRVISNFIYQAISNRPLTIHGNGNQTRSFCYIDDVIEALYLIGKSNRTNGEIFNLGNPEEISINELAKMIISFAGSDSSITFQNPTFADEAESRKPNITKIQSVIDWKPKYPLEEGLRLTINKLMNQ